jgi:hypothetical protein
VASIPRYCQSPSSGRWRRPGHRAPAPHSGEPLTWTHRLRRGDHRGCSSTPGARLSAGHRPVSRPRRSGPPPAQACAAGPARRQTVVSDAHEGIKAAERCETDVAEIDVTRRCRAIHKGGLVDPQGFNAGMKIHGSQAPHPRRYARPVAERGCACRQQ